MSRSKTDYGKLKSLGDVLEKWCDENLIEYTRCSEYQWNVKVPQVDVLLSVYPGSGVIWVPYAHYTNTGAKDQSATKHQFTNKKNLIKQLQEIIFAADMV